MSRMKPARRPRTPQIVSATAPLMSATQTAEHERDHRLVYERAHADSRRLSGRAGLTHAEATVETLGRLWNRALASIDAWERQVAWATDERVLTDCRNYCDMNKRSADAIRAKADRFGDLETVVPMRTPPELRHAVRSVPLATQAFVNWTADALGSFDQMHRVTNAMMMDFYCVRHLVRHQAVLNVLMREALTEFVERPTDETAARATERTTALLDWMAAAPQKRAASARKERELYSEPNVIDLASRRPRSA